MKKTSSRFISLTLIVFVALLIVTCEKDEIIPPPPTGSTPVITGFEPEKGLIGQEVTINGNFFIPPIQIGTFIFGSDATEVAFNGTKAEVDRINQDDENKQSITTRILEGATSGKITVTTEGKTGTSLSDFEVISSEFPPGAIPAIDEFTPSSTFFEHDVIIFGNNFIPTIAVGTHVDSFAGTMVKFNGTQAEIDRIYQEEADKQSILTRVPQGATSGKITVTANEITVESAADFNVIGPVYHPGVTVSTVANYAGPDVSIDNDGNLYVTSIDRFEIVRINTDGSITQLMSTANDPDRETPYGIVLDSEKNVFATLENRIIKISPEGSVENIAGGVEYGDEDGAGIAARFSLPFDIDIDNDGNLYVADLGNNKIRKIDPDGNVSTLAGSTQGYLDGPVAVAKFTSPQDVAVDEAGNVFVADGGNHKIRKITPDGNVTTIAGSSRGYLDGVASSAQFNDPRAISVDAEGNLYISDSGNYVVRMLTTNGMVVTLAGSVFGSMDGPGPEAQFTQTRGNTLDVNGALYVIQAGGIPRIRKLVID